MLEIFLKRGRKPLLLQSKSGSKIISGTSIHEIYLDGDGIEYFLKYPKRRKIRDFFKLDPFFNELIVQRLALLNGGVFNPYTEKPDEAETQSKIQALSEEKRSHYEQVQKNIEKYVEHVKEVMLTNTLVELLAPRLCAAIMGDMLVTPHSYFSTIEHSSVLISRSVGNFREFLSDKLLVAEANTPEYWLTHKTPSFKEFKLTCKEARILGQAYFVALLFGHNDVVNNINLSNFGYVITEDGSLKLSIVDWGNVLGIGFGGLTSEEGAFSNPQFVERSEIASPAYQPADVNGFKHTMPFDECVYPLLPRQVVVDLFDLTSNDVPLLREAQREGFYAACDQALFALGHVQELIAPIIKTTLQDEVPMDMPYLKGLLPEATYPTERSAEKTQPYNLPAVLEGRIRSLQKMKQELQLGTPLIKIAQERFVYIQQSQYYSRSRFFPRKVDTEIVNITLTDAHASQPVYG